MVRTQGIYRLMESPNIIMLEDAQKKAKRAVMPIAAIELVMMASAAVLAAQHLPHEVDDWEGLPVLSRTLVAWKTAFCLAISSANVRSWEPLGGAHGVMPAFPPALDRLELALYNLAPEATNDNAILEQLTTANLALTGTIAMLMATNKKWFDKAAAAPRESATPVASRVAKNPQSGNFCWTHRHRCSKGHTCATCSNKAAGHKNKATASNDGE
jgi:hypothetical protein